MHGGLLSLFIKAYQMEKVDMICSNALSLDEFFDNPTMGKATVYQEWENSQNTYTNYEKVAQNGLNA